MGYPYGTGDIEATRFMLMPDALGSDKLIGSFHFEVQDINDEPHYGSGYIRNFLLLDGTGSFYFNVEYMNHNGTEIPAYWVEYTCVRKD